MGILRPIRELFQAESTVNTKYSTDPTFFSPFKYGEPVLLDGVLLCLQVKSLKHENFRIL